MRNHKEFPIDNFIVCLLGALFFIWTILAYFPGCVSHDTLQQYEQAITGNYSDWHPPIMAFLWRSLMFLWPNPGVLLIFHNVCYWSLWCFLSLSFGTKGRAKLGVFLLGLLPPLWSQLHVLWKDTELSIALFGCFLLVTWIKLNRDLFSKWIMWGTGFLALAFFCYSTWVRANAVLALFPVAFFVFFEKGKRYSIVKAFFGSLFLTLLVYQMGSIVNYDWLKAKKNHISQLIQIHDIAGVYYRTGNAELLPNYWFRLDPGTTPQAIHDHYNPQSVDTLAWSGFVPITDDPVCLGELKGDWIKSIRFSPGAYLRHRWSCFELILGLGRNGPLNPFHFSIDPNSMGLREEGDPQIGSILSGYFSCLTGTWLFAGWFYLLMALGIALLTVLKLHLMNLFAQASFFSAVSALIYQCGYFFYGIGCDFRYLYSSIQMTFFSCVMLYLAFKDHRENGENAV